MQIINLMILQGVNKMARMDDITTDNLYIVRDYLDDKISDYQDEIALIDAEIARRKENNEQ